MSRNIVITSGKGGVGKSSLTAYLGVELCKLKKRVLLIDMDEGLRSLDLILNVSSNSAFDVTDVINEICPIKKAILPIPQCNGLFLIPAPAIKGEINDKYAIKQLVKELETDFDYILIDSPAGIGDGFYSSLIAANEAIVVVNPDPVCVRDGGIVSALLRKNNLDNIHLVINKVNTKLMLKGIFKNIDEIIDETEAQLIAAIPTDNKVISYSAKGELLPVCYAKDAFERLAHRLEGNHILLPNLKKFT